MKKDETKKIVRKGYAKVAKQGSSCCGPVDPCCGTSDRAADLSKKIGYTEEELRTVPEGANLGLGCGNPVAIASLKEGETVLDLGSGPGLDCFLAADKVGKSGKVIGVDMTHEMLERARANAEKGDYSNVEFRLAEIENLPVADNSVDVVISNCVINLSTDKRRVFQETFRVLRPGGRIMVSDVVLTKELPDFLKDSDEGYIGCISGAILRDDYLGILRNVGFREIEPVDQVSIPVDDWISDPFVTSIAEKMELSVDQAKEALGSIVSLKVKAVK
jgi:SAM-dependent methyltransferase